MALTVRSLDVKSLFFSLRLDQQLRLAVKVICRNNKVYRLTLIIPEVSTAFENAECGYFYDGFQLLAEDLNSDITHNGNTPNWQIFVHYLFTILLAVTHSG